VEAKYLRLTPRWTTLKPHPVQQSFVWHRARFKINPSGRRSGKTELLKRMAVMQLLKKRAWPAMVLLAAPSFGQARDIFWDDIKAMVPSHWLAGKPSETRLEVRTKWGAMIRIMGFDRPRRMEGVPWDFFGGDEIADCPPRCISLNVRPALATVGREGSACFVGVPDEVGRNQGEYEELYEIGLQWDPDRAKAKDPDTCSFHWKSADILSAAEIASLRKSLDDHAFEQEMGGRFVSSQGKALPKFDRAYHVDEDMVEYCPLLPLDWTMDFGVVPAASLLCQTYKGRVWVMDEIVLNDSSTEASAAEFRKRVAKNGYNTRMIRLYGDAAGNQRHSPIGVSDYDILRSRLGDLNVQWEELDAPPLVKDTLNAVRGRLATASGHVHLHVHPRCHRLIKDLKEAPWPDKHQLRGYHCLAALRYYCYRMFGDPCDRISTSGLHLPNHGVTSGRATN